MAEWDSGYKLLFSHPELVADLLRGFVPEPWVAEVDFATLTPVKGSYVSDGLRQRHDDCCSNYCANASASYPVG